MQRQMIQSNPSVMMGKPVVVGTRITVELILEKLGAGETVNQIMEAHPRLTHADILAAVKFGGQALRAARVSRMMRSLIVPTPINAH